MKKNIIVLPTYYKGTSFEQIVQDLKLIVKKGKLNIDFIGPKKSIKNKLTGFLLDDSSYLIDQVNTLKKLLSMNKVEKILFLDFFNLGFDLLKYKHEQDEKNVKYGALMHGGTFFDKDIYNQNWMKNYESAWFELYDVLYMPSSYGKSNVPKTYQEKVKVIPWGLDTSKVISSNDKKYDVVFPHRLSPDKGIEDFISLVKDLKEVNFLVASPKSKETLLHNKYFNLLLDQPNVDFTFGETKDKHKKTLSQAKIILSCSKQETFGYAVMNSVLSGCIPVLPNSECYPEFFKKTCLYNNHEEAKQMILSFIKNKGSHNKDNFLIQDVTQFSFLDHLNDFFYN